MEATKRCSKCKEIKSVSEFYKRKISRDGLQPICKTCRLKEEKEYYQTEKGKVVNRKANKKYQKTKKGRKTNCKAVARYFKTKKGKATQKRFYESEKYKAGQKRYRHREKGKANIKRWSRRYYNQYPERIKARGIVCYAVKTGRLPRPNTLQCHYCPAQAEQYHHRLGYAPEHWFDVVPICRKCHSKYGRKIA